MRGKNTAKFFKITFLSLTAFLFVLYVALCIYVKSKEVEIDPEKLLEDTTVFLSDEQLKIAGFFYNKDKNPKFEKCLLIKDIISQKNNVPKNISAMIIDDRHATMNEFRIKVLASSRNLIRKVDYKILYNYYFSKLYFGNGIYGLKEAALKYYGKDYTQLTPREFMCMCVITDNPAFYDFHEHKNRLYNRVDEIYNGFYKWLCPAIVLLSDNEFRDIDVLTGR